VVVLGIKTNGIESQLIVPLTGEVAFRSYLYVILRVSKANECPSHSMI